MSLKIKAWPWKAVLPKEFKAVEGASIADKEAKIGAIIEEFAAMVISHPLKKSSKDYASQDELNDFAKDAGIPLLEDDDYKGLKPDKKMNMVKIKNWKESVTKQLGGKKKGAPDTIVEDLLEKMKSAVGSMKTSVEAAIKKRAEEAAKLKTMNTFFNAIKAGDIKSLDSQLKANSWLLDVNHPQKGNSTPIMVAAREKQAGSIKWLLESKCDLTVTDSFDWTALNWAKDNDYEEGIKLLEDAGCEAAADEDEDEDDDDGEFHVNEVIS
ncbi:hypothetical protein AAMO2058_000898300 [Amorphochlora amoebiformis]